VTDSPGLSTDVPFAIVPLWLIESDVSDRALRLYSLLAGLRDYETGKCTPGRKWLAEKLTCSVDTVDRAKAELVKKGAVSVIQRREGLLNEANEYVVHRMPPSMRGSRTGAAGIAAGVAAPVRPNQEQNPDSSSSAPPTREDGQLDLIGGAPATSPDDGFPVKTVAGRKVTDLEKAMSRAIIATFNAKFDTDYRGKEHYIDVVGRIRERPELTLEDHGRIIENFATTTWWRKSRDGRREVKHPSVAHLYGSGKALDAAINHKPEDAERAGPDLSEYDR